MKTYIATFFKTKDKAIKDVKEKNRLWGKDKFVILEDSKGWFVLSKRQLGAVDNGSLDNTAG